MTKAIVRLLLANLLFACAAMALALPAEAKVLKIGHSTWVGYGPFYVARDKGFFKEEGVEVESVIMEDTSLKMGALLAGQIDLAASTSDEFPIYLKPGKSVKYLLAVDYSNGGDGIAASKDIKTIAGLKGKKVAFEHGSISQFFLNVLLKRNGLTQADIEPVNMTAAELRNRICRGTSGCGRDLGTGAQPWGAVKERPFAGVELRSPRCHRRRCRRHT